MKYSKGNIEYIIYTYLRLLTRVLSKKKPINPWTQNELHTGFDYDEIINFFLDDYNFIIKDHKELSITGKQLEKMKQFNNLLEDFDDSSIDTFDPKTFIESTEWQSILDAAKDVLITFEPIDLKKRKNIVDAYLKEENIKNAKKRLHLLLKNIEHITNKKHQVDNWIKNKNTESNNYEENHSNLSSNCEYLIEDYKQCNMSWLQRKSIKKFHKALKAFDEHLEEKYFYADNELPMKIEHINFVEYINSKEWKVVIDAAKDVLKAFNYQGQKNKYE